MWAIAYRLVLEDAHRIRVQQGRLPGRVEEIRWVHAEDVRQGDHLVHGGIGEFSRPDLFDVFLAQVPQAHACYFGVGERGTRFFVSDDVK